MAGGLFAVRWGEVVRTVVLLTSEGLASPEGDEEGILVCSWWCAVAPATPAAVVAGSGDCGGCDGMHLTIGMEAPMRWLATAAVTK